MIGRSALALALLFGCAADVVDPAPAATIAPVDRESSARGTAAQRTAGADPQVVIQSLSSPRRSEENASAGQAAKDPGRDPVSERGNGSVRCQRLVQHLVQLTLEALPGDAEPNDRQHLREQTSSLAQLCGRGRRISAAYEDCLLNSQQLEQVLECNPMGDAGAEMYNNARVLARDQNLMQRVETILEDTADIADADAAMRQALIENGQRELRKSAAAHAAASAK